MHAQVELEGTSGIHISVRFIFSKLRLVYSVETVSGAGCSTPLQLNQRMLYRAVRSPSTGKLSRYCLDLKLSTATGLASGATCAQANLQTEPHGSLCLHLPHASHPVHTVLCFHSDPLAAYTSQAHHAPQRAPGRGRGEVRTQLPAPVDQIFLSTTKLTSK